MVIVYNSAEKIAFEFEKIVLAKQKIWKHESLIGWAKFECILPEEKFLNYFSYFHPRQKYFCGLDLRDLVLIPFSDRTFVQDPFSLFVTISCR